VADLYAQRSFLESRAARSAALHITPQELAELHDLHAHMRADLTLDTLSDYAQLNRRFHQTIYRASRRDYLVRALDQIWAAFPTMMMSYFAQTAAGALQTLAERKAQDLAEHEAIVKALQSGDASSAETLMHQHIEANCQELLSVLDCGE
jgi:DNA-binding GntR family transcriptional regulator